MGISTRRHETGFTIVELLIVIVVIGILAAITIVAYNGIQRRAGDTKRTSEISSVMKALEMYKADVGNYPLLGSENTGYALSGLASALVPTYISTLPTDPGGGAGAYEYVRGSVGSGTYGIRMNYKAKPPCHMGVNNVGINWWSMSACS